MKCGKWIRTELDPPSPSCKQDNGTDLAPQQYFATQASVWTVHIPHLISLDVYLFPLFAIGLISLLGTAVAVTQRSPQLDIYFCFFVVSGYLVRQLSSLKCALNLSLFLEWSSVGVSCDHCTGESLTLIFCCLVWNLSHSCPVGCCHFGCQSLISVLLCWRFFINQWLCRCRSVRCCVSSKKSYYRKYDENKQDIRQSIQSAS